ncbi:hypothetical protein LUZ63_020389 [Rhynchospora breviuscula]|uniref:MFS transporter n=1 Tax=Rhynchospora breviuscula TaxID=2022672 RepID=A0A9Q0C0S0_9POAL|nr:hypothetical protein LUZ63_020389 [Rhynchospora breviuscula]
MIIGAPLMPMATLRVPRRVTMVVALLAFAAAHVVAAVTTSFAVLLVSRFLAALATGTFWALAAVVAAALVGPQRSSTALGVVLGGGDAGQRRRRPGRRVRRAGRRPARPVRGAGRARRHHRPRRGPHRRHHERHPGRGEPAVGPSRARHAALGEAVGDPGDVRRGQRRRPVGLQLRLAGAHRPCRPGRLAHPFALVLFGVGAFVGNLLGGRAGERRPHRAMAITVSVSVVAMAALLVLSTLVVPSLIAFAVLGLVGLFANPVLVSLAVRYGGAGATLPSAMATSAFNAGTAVGTAITSTLLGTGLGALSAPVVGLVFGVLAFVPLAVLARAGARTGEPLRRADDEPRLEVPDRCPA